MCLLLLTVSLCDYFQRLPFTLAFIGSMIGTIYVSMVRHSYVLSVVFSVVQVSVSYILKILLCRFALPCVLSVAVAVD